MRLRGLTGLVAGLALLGGATAAVSAPSVRVAAPTLSGTTVTTLPSYGERGTHVVSYRHGAVLTLSVPVANTGRLPLAVTSARLVQAPLALLTVRPVESTRVGAGETGQVVLEAVLGNCKYFHERETQSYDSLQLEVSVLGRSATRTVRFDRPLLVHSPMIVGCPDRTLDRQRHDRTGAPASAA